MKKIKDIIIHWLGGHTETEYLRESQNAFDKATEEYAEETMYEHCHTHHIDVPNHIVKDALRRAFKAGYRKAMKG